MFTDGKDHSSHTEPSYCYDLWYNLQMEKWPTKSNTRTGSNLKSGPCRQWRRVFCSTPKQTTLFIFSAPLVELISQRQLLLRCSGGIAQSCYQYLGSGCDKKKFSLTYGNLVEFKCREIFSQVIVFRRRGIR